MERKARRPRARWIAFGVVGAVALARSAAAQTTNFSLTVQPRTMATGTQNPAAGKYRLEAEENLIVSVPPQCVGARRCPLLLALPGGGQQAEVMTAWLGPVADRYGFILMAPGEAVAYKADILDAALKEVLEKYAIDPTKIAISGRCATGGTGMNFGVRNSHVFSRIAVVSGITSADGLDPQNKAMEFLIDAGYQESTPNFSLVTSLQDAGYSVRHTVTLRGHEHQKEDYDFLGRWLAESWAKPDPKSRTVPTVIDPLPELTTDAVAKLTAFWTSFFKEPDSIWNTGRWPHIRDVVAPIFKERPIIPMTDMAAMAARYPSVAAALKSAGLTGQQHDAYRLALAAALIAQSAGGARAWAGTTTEPNSVMTKNIVFVDEHADGLKMLAAAGMANPRAFRGWAMPDEADKFGPMGIWRTP